MFKTQLSNLKRVLTNKGAERISEVLPLIITVNGEEKFILASIKDIVAIGDLHPRVRNMIKAQELKARAGMGVIAKVEATELPAE